MSNHCHLTPVVTRPLHGNMAAVQCGLFSFQLESCFFLCTLNLWFATGVRRPEHELVATQPHLFLPQVWQHSGHARNPPKQAPEGGRRQRSIPRSQLGCICVARYGVYAFDHSHAAMHHMGIPGRQNCFLERWKPQSNDLRLASPSEEQIPIFSISLLCMLGGQTAVFFCIMFLMACGW